MLATPCKNCPNMNFMHMQEFDSDRPSLTTKWDTVRGFRELGEWGPKQPGSQEHDAKKCRRLAGVWRAPDGRLAGAWRASGGRLTGVWRNVLKSHVRRNVSKLGVRRNISKSSARRNILWPCFRVYHEWHSVAGCCSVFAWHRYQSYVSFLVTWMISCVMDQTWG